MTAYEYVPPKNAIIRDRSQQTCRKRMQGRCCNGLYCGHRDGMVWEVPVAQGGEIPQNPFEDAHVRRGAIKRSEQLKGRSVCGAAHLNIYACLSLMQTTVPIGA